MPRPDTFLLDSPYFSHSVVQTLGPTSAITRAASTVDSENRSCLVRESPGICFSCAKELTDIGIALMNWASTGQDK